MAVMQQVIEKGRGIRDRHNLSMRTPLPEVTLVHQDPAALRAIARLQSYVADELNVRTVKTALVAEVPALVRFKCMPNHKALGARFGQAYKQVQADIRALTHEQLAGFMASGTMAVGAHGQFAKDDIVVSLEYAGDTATCDAEALADGGGLVLLSKRPDAGMLEEAMAREVCAKVQKMRKEAGLQKSDEVEVGFAVDDAATSTLARVLVQQREYIAGRIGKPLLAAAQLPALAVPLAVKKEEVRVQTLDPSGGISALPETLALTLCRGCAFIDGAALAKLLPEPRLADGATAYVHGKDFGRLRAELAGGKGTLSFQLDGTAVTLRLGTHLFLSSTDALKAGAL